MARQTAQQQSGPVLLNALLVIALGRNALHCEAESGFCAGTDLSDEVVPLPRVGCRCCFYAGTDPSDAFLSRLKMLNR